MLLSKVFLILYYCNFPSKQRMDELSSMFQDLSCLQVSYVAPRFIN